MRPATRFGRSSGCTRLKRGAKLKSRCGPFRQTNEPIHPNKHTYFVPVSYRPALSSTILTKPLGDLSGLLVRAGGAGSRSRSPRGYYSAVTPVAYLPSSAFRHPIPQKLGRPPSYFRHGARKTCVTFMPVTSASGAPRIFCPGNSR